MAAEYIEHSFFPEIVDDRPLGSDQAPQMPAKLRTLAESLKPLYAKTRYGKINAKVAGLLTLSRKGSCVTQTPKYGKESDEHYYWQHSGHPDDQTLTSIRGYTDEYYEVEIDGALQPALRVVQNVTDIGYEDTLILVGDIKSIETVPPITTEILIIVANNKVSVPFSDPQYLDEEHLKLWSEAVEEYLDNGPEYRTAWTPESGIIDAWGS